MFETSKKPDKNVLLRQITINRLKNHERFLKDALTYSVVKQYNEFANLDDVIRYLLHTKNA